MKLPEIQYGGRVSGAGTISPGAAVSQARSEQGILDAGFRVGQQIAEQKIEHDAARANAAYRDEIVGLQTALAQRDELSRDELIALGGDETNPNIRWVDDDGNEVQTFKKYEVEAALMSQVMEDRISSAGANIASSKYRQAWQDSVREANQEEILRITQRSAREAEEYEYKRAIADVEALANDPTAQIEYLNTNPVFADRPEVKQRYMNAAKDAEFSIEANQNIYNGTDAELNKFINDMKDPEYRGNLPISEKRAVILTNRAISEQRRRQVQADRLEAKAERAEAKNQRDREALAREELKNLVTADQAGMEIPDADLARVRNNVAGTEYEEPFNVFQNTRVFSVMTAEQQAEKMNALSGIDDADQFQAYAKERARIDKGLDDYGIDFAYQQGIEEPIPISLNDPDSWAARQAQAERLSVHYGRPVSPLSQNEVEQFSQMLGNMTVQEQLGLVDTFASTPEVWSQFAKSGDAVFALVGASGDSALSNLALHGRNRIDNEIVIPPTRKDYTQVTNDYLSGVYKPEDQAAITETALGVYAMINEDEEFNETNWKAALKMVTGGVDAVNGYSVQLPRNTDADAMQHFVDNFSAEQVVRFGRVDGMDDDVAAEYISNARWKSVGNDIYYVLDRGGRVLMSPPSAEYPVARPLTIMYTADDAADVQADEAYRKWARQHQKTFGSYQPTEAW